MDVVAIGLILIGMGVGVSHISNQIASLTSAVTRQTTDLNRHHQEPNIFVPSADEIAAAIVVQLDHHSSIAKDIAEQMELAFMSGHLQTAISFALEGQTDQLKRAIEWQIGFSDMDTLRDDVNKPLNLTQQLDEIKVQLEVIGNQLNKSREV